MMPGMSLSRFSWTLWVGILIACMAVLSGCRRDGPRALFGKRPAQTTFGPQGLDSATKSAYPLRDDAIRLTETDEQIYVFNGRTGEPITGRQMAQRLRAADVVILGETHDDPMAHRLQQRFVRQALSGGSGALSLEMMSRDEQPVLSRLSRRAGTAEAQLEPTSLSKWPSWYAFYLPTIQAALARGRPVIAANAPRAMVTSARTYGYAYLRDLPRDDQRLFDLPEAEDHFPDYRRRVMEVAASHRPASQPSTAPGAGGTRPSTRPQRERLDAHGPLESVSQAATRSAGRPPTRPATTPAQARATRSATRPATQPILPATRRVYPPRDPMSPEAFYEAQLIWDATMARSILAARRHGRPVVHLVGSFHSDFDGGLTQMLERRGQKVLTVSFVPADSQRLQPEDEGRADIVIYTGANRPPPPARVVLATKPATRPATRPSPPPRAPATQPGRQRPSR